MSLNYSIMDEGNSCSTILELNLFGMNMKVRNNPIRIGNNVLTFVAPYNGDRREYEIPMHVRKTYNKVAVSNNIVYLNGYELNTETGEWSRTVKATIINFFL